MALSAVAGIVDRKGGFRVVVTARWRMRYHVGKGERLFVVPNFKVQEPIPYEDWYRVVETARAHTLKCIAPTNHCGECRACCVAFYIKAPDFEKQAHTKCPHLCSSGCGIYFARPQPCRQFECVWLKSQRRNDVMPPELRPDRCGVFFVDRDTLGNDPLVFEVHPDPMRPQLLDSELVRSYINDMQRAGYKAKLITHYPTGDAP